jgi:hypothetical protein
MKNNLITNEYQENEINKILQDGIDKSLLYINSFNTSNFRNFSKSSKLLTNKKNEEKISNSLYNNTYFQNLPKDNNNSQKIKIGFIPLTKSQLNIKSKSLNKTLKHYNKKNLAYYQIEYNKKREELENSKNELIKERIKQNKLQNDMRIRLKKEKEFNKIEENDNMIQKNSEDLILRIQQSERIREEQTKIIERLLSEYNFMINKLRRNPNIEIVNKYEELKLEADNLKNEGLTITKKKKLNKKKIFKK